MKPEQKSWPACGERRNLETRPKVTIVLDERGEPVRLLDTTYGDDQILKANS